MFVRSTPKFNEISRTGKRGSEQGGQDGSAKKNRPTTPEEVCAICLEDIKAKETVKLPCTAHHEFHSSCMRGWVIENDNDSCPKCREDITSYSLLRRLRYKRDQACLAGDRESLAQIHYELGKAYYYGSGVSKNLGEAKCYLEMAVAENNAGAQSLLGLMYYEGKGVRENKTLGLELLEKARAQGHAGAINVMQRLNLIHATFANFWVSH